MIKLTSLILAFGLICMPLVAQAEEERGTTEEAIAMAEQVKADFLANGLEATAKAITEEKKYNKKDLYPFLYDMSEDQKATILAHGTKAQMVGMNRWDARDELQGGKLFVQEFVTLAKTGKPGWVDYKFPDPITKKSIDKTSYILPINEKYFIGVGIYKPDAAAK